VVQLEFLAQLTQAVVLEVLVIVHQVLMQTAVVVVLELLFSNIQIFLLRHLVVVLRNQLQVVAVTKFLVLLPQVFQTQ
jgi:hypothetical protein